MKTKVPTMFISLMLSLVMFATGYSQNTSQVRQYLDRLFEHTQLDKVPTGFLLDYAIDLVDFNNFSGEALTDSNYVSATTFETILASIKSADVTHNHLSDLKVTLQRFREKPSDSNLTLGIACYLYNYLPSDALSGGKIEYLDEQVYDTYDDHGEWINPYERATIVCFSPNNNYCSEGSITFSIDPSFIFSNTSIDQILFDAGTGDGYVPIVNSVTYNYFEGDYQLRLKVRSNGQWLECHSFLNVQKRIINSHWAGGVLYDYFYGSGVSAQLSAHLRSGPSIRNPLLIVEGFDPWELEDAMGTYVYKLYDKVQEGVSTYRRMMSLLNNHPSILNDYDILYVDWNNSYADIKENAGLLKQIIKYIHDNRDASDSSGIVLLGQSMGGLIARYALCDMENKGLKHNVTTFISHDTPHLGANVPLGALYFARSLVSLINKYNKEDIKDLYIGKNQEDFSETLMSVLQATSVRQMLLNNVREAVDTGLIIDNTEHRSWQKCLKEMGFPKGDNGKSIENLAIINGRTPIPDSCLIDGDSYLKIDGFAKIQDWLYALTSFSLNLDIEANIKAFTPQNAGREISKLSIKFKKKFLWLIKKTNHIFTGASYLSPSEGPYYDTYPGSIYYLDSSKDTSSKTNVFARLRITEGIAKGAMFIPAASALSVNDAVFESASSRDFYINPPKPNIETPFDAYYLCDKSEEHISLTTSMLDWLYKQLNLEIVGPSTAESSGDYTLSGISSGIVKWETSNTNVARIDSYGHLTAMGNGEVTITASAYQDGKLYRKSKKVMVSYPDIVLTSKFIIGEGYRVSVNALGVEQSNFDEVIAGYNMEYEWTFIDKKNVGIIVSYSSEGSYSFLPTPGSSVTVCVRIVDKETRLKKGKVYSLSFNPKTYFEFNYDQIIIASLNEVFFIRGNDFDINTPEDLTVIFGGLPPVDDAATMKRIMDMVDGEPCYLSVPFGSEEHGFNNRKRDLYGTHFRPEGESSRWRFNYFDSPVFSSILEDVARIGKEDVTTLRFILKDKNKKDIHNLSLPISFRPNYSVDSSL